MNATVRGAPWNPDWSASWSVATVDDGWRTPRADLARAFAELRSALEGDPDVRDPMMLRGVLAPPPRTTSARSAPW